MNEVVFLRRYAGSWKEAEEALDGERPIDPDALSSLYTRLTDDLAWARTFYPGSKTTEYLNDLTGRIHRRLHGSRREEWGRIFGFWIEEWPRLLYTHRR